MSVTQSAPRQVAGWLRYVLYASWFSFCFLTFTYLTFPLGLLRPAIVSAAEKQLGKGAQGRYGVDPRVEIGAMSLSGGLGVKFERVQVQLGSTDPDPGPVIDLDSLSLRVGLLSTLLGTPKVEYGAKLYRGELSGDVELGAGKGYEKKWLGGLRSLIAGKPGNLTSVSFEVEDVDLGQAPPVVAKVGVPVSGVLGGSVDLELGESPDKEGAGAIDLAVRGVNLGPGELKIPVPGLTGGLTLPLIDLGDLQAKVNFEKGKGKTEKLAMSGRDVNADVSLEIDLNRKLTMSRVSGSGGFQIADAFLDQNAKFKTILDFAAPLKAARGEDGKYAFHLRGTLSRPGFKLGAQRGASSRRKPRVR